MSSQEALVSKWLAHKKSGLAANAVLILAGSIVIAALAQISIPLPWTPVPITGQSFGVTLISLMWGRSRAVLAVGTYLAMALAGFPVLALGHSAYSLGPTVGYLLGMLLAAALMGALADHGWTRSFWKTWTVALLGSGVIFACGLTGLAFFLPANTLLTAGLWPFLPGDCLKTALASGIVREISRRHSSPT